MVSHSEKLAVCASCDLKTVNMDEMKEHIRLSHDNNEVNGKEGEMCDWCRRKFSSPDDLRNHIKTIHKSPVIEEETVQLILLWKRILRNYLMRGK